MIEVISSGGPMGVVVEGVNLSRPLADETRQELERLLCRNGVLCFRDQALSSKQVRDFSATFGTLEINVAGGFQEPEFPEVMILSNIVRDGRPIGLSDAGQSWHTDMSYSGTVAFANVLYAIEVPVRDGEPLGRTEFCDMHAAYAALPAAVRRKLANMTVVHDFDKFWEMMRRDKGSNRPPLTDAQRRAKPPVSHPIFPIHPVTRRRVLYANPGYSVRINEMDEVESAETLAFLFEHQTQERFQYRHRWQVGDVLMWDNLGTIHNAVADYGPAEHRHIKRCQIAADRFPELAP